VTCVVCPHGLFLIPLTPSLPSLGTPFEHTLNFGCTFSVWRVCCTHLSFARCELAMLWSPLCRYPYPVPPYPHVQMQAGLYPGQVPQAMAQAMGMPPVSMSMVGAMPGTGSDGLAAATAVVPAAMLTGTVPAVPTSAPASAPGAIAAAPSHFEFPVAAGVCA
jgi:hypothetical protein